MINSARMENRIRGTSRFVVLLGVAFTLLLWLFMVEAGGDLENQIKDVRFAPHPTFSRLIFEMKKEFTYNLTPDFPQKRIIMRVADTKIPEEFKRRKISDARIRGVSFKESKETGELLITVFLRYPRNSIYHLSLEGPPRLVLDIEKKDGKPRRSAKALLKRKTFPELEEKEEERGLMARADVPEETEELPDEPMEEDMGLSREELDRRDKLLLQIDEKNIGKDTYMEGLKLFQKKKFYEAYLKLSEFTDEFPESPYANNAYYILASCQFNLIDTQKPDYTAAIQDYRKALRKFPRSPNRDSALFNLGIMYFSTNLKLEARAAIDEIIQMYGKGRYGLQAKLMKANMYYAEKQYKNAYGLYKEVVKLSPYSPEAKAASFSIADYLYDTNNHEQALRVYMEATRRWPTYPRMHPHIIFNLGNLYFDKKDYKKARSNFFLLANLFPNFQLTPKAMTLLGDSYMREGRDQNGLKVFSETVRREGKSAEGNYSRIRIAEIGARRPGFAPKNEIFKTYQAYYEPIKTYQDISAKFPDEPESVADALLQEGVALSQKKQFLRAISAFRKIRNQFPETTQSNKIKPLIQKSFRDMVNAYSGQEGFLPLLSAFHENLDPYLRDIKDLKVLFMIADAYQKVGLDEIALKYYQKMRELDTKGKFRDAMIVKLSGIQIGRGNYKEAVIALKRFGKSYPRSKYRPKAVSLMGEAMSKQGKPREAAARYSEFLTRFPKAEDRHAVAYRLGMSLKKLKEFPQAITAFQTAIKSFKPKDPIAPPDRNYIDSFYEIGDCLYMGGDYEKAVKAYKRAVEKFKDEPRNLYAKYFTGESYAKLKKDGSAESELKGLAESPTAQIWARAAELSNSALKWEKGYQKIF